MPKELEDCVQTLLDDPDFKPKDGEDKKAAAYAVCTARLKDSDVQKEETQEMTESNQVIKRMFSFEASPIEGTSSDWRVRIISAGTSKNNRTYPLNVLHRDKGVFEGVPVHAGNGPDHAQHERGVRSIVGFIKNVDAVPDGLDATFHVSDPILKDTLLDLHQEGVLHSVVGFSIVAEGRWQHDIVSKTETALQLVRADSVDLVREPAAGGKFLAVAESEEVIQVDPLKEDKEMEMSEERLQELLAEASSKAVTEFKESVTKDEEVKEEVTVEAVAEDKTAEKVSEALTQLNATLLTSALTNASLPEIAEQRIRSHFAGSNFDADEVQKAIADEKDYLASVSKVAVENITKESGKVSTDEADKKLARIDASFETSRSITLPSGERINGYRTFTEAYCDWTGKNPLDIGREEVWESWNKGGNGYASWREEAVNRIYTEAFDTSDWGEVTADRMHKALLKNYDNITQYDDWKKISRIISVNDYQAYRDIKVGGFANLAVVAEGAAYANLTDPTDEETTITMEKRGGIAYQITRELVLNDNISAIAEVPKELARSAARTLYDGVFGHFTANSGGGTTYAGQDLFVAGHGNNIGTAALTHATLSSANQVMRSQTKFGAGADVLGAANKPAWLMIPNELEGLASRIVGPSSQVITQILANTDDDEDVTRFSGMGLIVVDSWTDANNWYLAADPSQAAGITVAFLNGNQEPELFVQNDETQGDTFTNDVQSIKIRHEWATAIADYRGLFGNVVA